MISLRFTTFTINVNCICWKKGKDKTVFVTENFCLESKCLPPQPQWNHLNNFGVKYAKFGVFVNPVC